MEETIHVENYYTCLGNMLAKYDRMGRRDRLVAQSLGEYLGWKARVRGILWNLLGLDAMERCDPSPEIVERVTLPDGIVREKLLLRVEPGVIMSAYILIPRTDAKPSCVLCPHGHLGAGKYSVAGRADVPAVAEAIGTFGYDYGLRLARMGFVALCPDCRGFGERREGGLQGDSPEAFMNGSCAQLAHMAEPLGCTVIGMLTWDLMRLIDYALARGEWDSSRLGCVGFSGGGMQTLWLAAMDDRVSSAVISGYMYGYRDSLLELNGNCGCNYVPRLFAHVDMGDVGALIAPRPLLVQSCRDDHLNGRRGLANATEQVEVIRGAYRLFGKEGLLVHDIREGGHHFDPRALSAFFAAQ